MKTGVDEDFSHYDKNMTRICELVQSQKERPLSSEAKKKKKKKHKAKHLQRL